MNLISLKRDETRCFNPENDIFSRFRLNQESDSGIHEDMTPEEISEVVSDRLMDVIRQQFEAAKAEYQSKTDQ